jgi:hypothetical protein
MVAASGDRVLWYALPSPGGAAATISLKSALAGCVGAVLMPLTATRWAEHRVERNAHRREAVLETASLGGDVRALPDDANHHNDVDFDDEKCREAALIDVLLAKICVTSLTAGTLLFLVFASTGSVEACLASAVLVNGTMPILVFLALNHRCIRNMYIHCGLYCL